MGARLIDDFTRNISSVPFCPYHFVHTILSNTILSVYHFVHTILSLSFCPIPFCPRTIYTSSLLLLFVCELRIYAWLRANILIIALQLIGLLWFLSDRQECSRSRPTTLGPTYAEPAYCIGLSCSTCGLRQVLTCVHKEMGVAVHHAVVCLSICLSVCLSFASSVSLSPSVCLGYLPFVRFSFQGICLSLITSLYNIVLQCLSICLSISACTGIIKYFQVFWDMSTAPGSKHCDDIGSLSYGPKGKPMQTIMHFKQKRI